MRPTTKAPLALLALLTLAGPALADPEFRGPEIYDGAWEVTRAWSDPAAGPNDRSKGSFAYAYRTWAMERARQHEQAGTLLDCADLSIDLVIEYAALNGLPIEWRVYYPAEKKFITFRNTDRQFDQAADFSTWSKWFLGAINLADNTVPITYDQWTGGDMVLFNWNQDPAEPNFPGRTVWHTYLVGDPSQSLIFYGNMNGGAPLPVVSTTSPSTMERVLTHPDRYGASPRRYRFMANAITPPEVRVDEVVVRASSLLLRAGPSSTFPVVTRVRRDERLQVLARQGVYVQVRHADGRTGWGHAAWLRSDPRWTPAPTTPPVVEATPGLAGGLPGF